MRGGECGLPLAALYDQLLAKKKTRKILVEPFWCGCTTPRGTWRRGGEAVRSRYCKQARGVGKHNDASRVYPRHMRMRCMERVGEPLLEKRARTRDGRRVMSQVLSLRVYCIRDLEWPTHGSTAAVVLKNGKRNRPLKAASHHRKGLASVFSSAGHHSGSPHAATRPWPFLRSRFSSPFASALLSLSIRLRV